ncbi:MAG TPA: DUF2892 domain-containing protein [Ktedonobacterales bacterium]|nr:DUF2892 domain-containing protein [Ktedonobacterales bacterium]
MGFASFMSSPAGRLLRVVAGLVVIGGGALALIASNTILGVVLVIVGLLPLVAGLSDFCVFAPLFGAPLSGAQVRARQQAHTR